jgi:hypothetical protein
MRARWLERIILYEAVPGGIPTPCAESESVQSRIRVRLVQGDAYCAFSESLASRPTTPPIILCWPVHVKCSCRGDDCRYGNGCAVPLFPYFSQQMHLEMGASFRFLPVSSLRHRGKGLDVMSAELPRIVLKRPPADRIDDRAGIPSDNLVRGFTHSLRYPLTSPGSHP